MRLIEYAKRKLERMGFKVIKTNNGYRIYNGTVSFTVRTQRDIVEVVKLLDSYGKV